MPINEHNKRIRFVLIQAPRFLVESKWTNPFDCYIMEPGANQCFFAPHFAHVYGVGNRICALFTGGCLGLASKYTRAILPHSQSEFTS